jgi:hypothetical protein
MGWNQRYLTHSVICKERGSQSYKSLILMSFVFVLILGYPAPSESLFSNTVPTQPLRKISLRQSKAPSVDPVVVSMEEFLKRYEVDKSQRGRVAQSIVRSARKYDLEPRLIASIMIVESRAKPFAISEKNSIGMMQIHLPTWGQTADREGINLFKIEDNVDFGTRILKAYVRQFGVWPGVKRYNGWIADNPGSEQSAESYLAKVQRIYGFKPSAAPATLTE